MPSWLVDSPLDFNDVLKPPSYLIASLEQAFDDYALHNDPPTYEHSVAAAAGSSRAPSTRRMSLAGESIWEDDDDEEDDSVDGSSADADDEDDGVGDSELDIQCSERKGKRDSDGQSTLYRMPLHHFPSVPSTSASTPTPPDDGDRSYQARPLPPIPRIPPVAYHLLHLQHIMNTSEADPYSELAICLSSIDPLLLLKPFAVFGEMCYEDAVRGDTSEPVLRPFSPPPALSVSHSSSLTDESEDEDEEVLRSPTQAPLGPISPAETVVPPLVWDPRTEERVRGVSGPGVSLHIPRSMSQDELQLPVSPISGKQQHIRFVSRRRSVKPLIMQLMDVY